MRGKVIYRIACGSCSVCITYGLIPWFRLLVYLIYLGSALVGLLT